MPPALPLADGEAVRAGRQIDLEASLGVAAHERRVPRAGELRPVGAVDRHRRLLDREAGGQDPPAKTRPRRRRLVRAPDAPQLDVAQGARLPLPERHGVPGVLADAPRARDRGEVLDPDPVGARGQLEAERAVGPCGGGREGGRPPWRLPVR